ncbi:hypothetical protein L6452_18210 [Arctium lappa]|uniref:Uncharacterized protein n=1 Tax=Arctium lappa TaxID=4217 RepID=A0ACB9C5Q6_ARCLA|nr:hypothetical protein L6452_18210 [Arctium lappa]
MSAKSLTKEDLVLSDSSNPQYTLSLKVQEGNSISSLHSPTHDTYHLLGNPQPIPSNIDNHVSCVPFPMKDHAKNIHLFTHVSNNPPKIKDPQASHNRKRIFIKDRIKNSPGKNTKLKKPKVSLPKPQKITTQQSQASQNQTQSNQRYGKPGADNQLG